MHPSVMTWVAEIVDQLGLKHRKVLEVGSLNENGSVRQLFDFEYIGVDMRPGPGVDQVALAHDLPFEDESFDVVISTEMLEHDRQFWLSLPEMGRVLRTDGHMILTARGNGFPHHAYPNDYWRFMPSSAPALLELAGCSTSWNGEDPYPQHPGIFCLGRRNPRRPPECTCENLITQGLKHSFECPYGQWLLVEQANEQIREGAPVDLT